VSAGAFGRARLDRSSTGRAFQSLRRELGIESFGMNLMTLAAGQRGRVHTHELQEEVYLVLEGKLTLIVDGEEHVLGPDELARVGPALRRQLVNAGAERVLVLALGGSGEHAGRDGRAWSTWEEGGEGAPPQQVPLPEDLPGG
jgi:uncharacterized cupin superfamily protein